MTIQEYQIAAQRTMAKLGDLVNDSLHMTVGMNTECTELLEAYKQPQLDLINIQEEIGDFMWYFGNYATLHNLPLTDKMMLPSDTSIISKVINFIKIEILGELLFRRDTKRLIEDIIICIGNLQDLDKKLFAYKKPYDINKQYNLFVKLNQLILKYCIRCEFDINKIIQTNIDKLKARYPEKFSESNAVNRNLEAERKILEKGN